MAFHHKNFETIILSVGGSLIVPNGDVDHDFLNKLNKFVREQIKKGKRFIIVVGGGKLARHYRDAGKAVIGELTNEDLDWLGIHATRLNAHLIRTIFKDIAHPRIIMDYDRKLLNWNQPVAIGAGWKPGWSTDYDAVVVARDYHASVIINLSNIDYVFDKDPRIHKDALPIKKTTWDYFENIVGNEWVPGINAPFDPVASQLAKKHHMTVIVANGKNFANLENILNGEPFKGTVITPYKVDNSYYDREYFEGKKGEYKFSYSESYFGRLLQRIANFYRAFWIKTVINPKNVLDVGCGNGSLIYYLRKFDIEAYGVEISKYAMETAPKELQPFIKFGDITKIPYKDDSFDLVVSFDVLEHIERSKLRKSVDESIRVSRKFVLHKIFTQENTWIKLLHDRDFSHVSVFRKSFWHNIFRSFDNVMIVRKVYFKLPSFVESLFLLRKKD